MTGKPVGNLSWISAMIVAGEGKFDAVADLLRNEAFTLDMRQRRWLAAVLTRKPKVGPKFKADRDLHLYLDVTGFKRVRGIKRLPNVELLIMVSGGRSSQKTIQRASRALRKTETKNCATILDFSDKFHPIGSFHAKKRMTCYRQLGCIFQ